MKVIMRLRLIRLSSTTSTRASRVEGMEFSDKGGGKGAAAIASGGEDITEGARGGDSSTERGPVPRTSIGVVDWGLTGDPTWEMLMGDAIVEIGGVRIGKSMGSCKTDAGVTTDELPCMKHFSTLRASL